VLTTGAPRGEEALGVEERAELWGTARIGLPLQVDAPPCVFGVESKCSVERWFPGAYAFVVAQGGVPGVLDLRTC
jgi:hypothetical protein